MFSPKTMNSAELALPIGKLAHPKLAAMADKLTGRKPEIEPLGCEGVALDNGVLASHSPDEPFYYLARFAGGWRVLGAVARHHESVRGIAFTRIPDPERERLARLRRDREEQERLRIAAEEEARKRILQERQREWARYVRETAEAHQAQYDIELKRAREIGQRHERMYGREPEAAV